MFFFDEQLVYSCYIFYTFRLYNFIYIKKMIVSNYIWYGIFHFWDFAFGMREKQGHVLPTKAHT